MAKPKIKGKIKKYRKGHPRKFMIYTILAICGLIIGIYFAGSALGLFGAGPATTGDATVQVIDSGDNKDVSEKADISVYESPDSETLSTKDRHDLVFGDYDRIIRNEKADEIKFYIKENHNYWMKIKYAGTELWQLADPGKNVVMIIDKTEGFGHINYDVSGDTTMLGNPLLEYIVKIFCDDDKGLQTDYLFDIDDSNLIWFDFNLTRTAQTDYARIDDYYNQKEVSGTHLYIGVTGSIVNSGEYTIIFALGKAAGVWDCISINVGFGLYSAIDYME